MTNTIFKEVTVNSALNKLKRKIPYGWDLNIYRGCQHGCHYCYAMYSHQYLDSTNFFKEIYVKTNIIEELEKELSRESWQREVINIGGVTDSYQPAEAKYKLMPEILKLLIKYRTPAIISTKSNLILRDYDLIDELSRITYINVAATITTMDESVRMKIEPGSSTSLARFEVLKAFRKTNASTGLHLMPIIPYITDNEENFDHLFRKASECIVHYVLPGTLYLRGHTRKHFFEFIDKEFPSESDKIKALYKTGGADKEYKNELYKMVNRIRDQYKLSSSYMKVMREKL
ncbi:radical SAM protein [Neobacillus sp. LXY-4]|uniref:SPL family radical SAM protein n=1 Tax=Neobacillus sp. LXY-4 TaxID=3379826 RepID=UPI003EDFD385